MELLLLWGLSTMPIAKAGQVLFKVGSVRSESVPYVIFCLYQQHVS